MTKERQGKAERRRVAHTRSAPGTPGFREDAAPFVVALLDHAGGLAVDRVADAFGMSKQQLAETIGLARETLYKPDRARAPKTQCAF